MLASAIFILVAALTPAQEVVENLENQAVTFSQECEEVVSADVGLEQLEEIALNDSVEEDHMSDGEIVFDEE
jgi:hypothetical protein